ncbi:hypothetical protein [Pseudomonas gingeri]|uniref:Uncharacterized protein n=1 Tax=Pseudomonas gingeri TaxID=117681 RepID=A0A7Y7YIA7_9PSED|nr:hypothetical protein [Pseudomonas gingeri]NWB31148.1 hypothetical protein [Pseudomonas gingeri]NWC37043.1 hypothetical protein [Pseudomonas gingeri]
MQVLSSGRRAPEVENHLEISEVVVARLKLYTHWREWMTFDFTDRQLLSLKRHIGSDGDSTIKIGGYAFRCIQGHLYFSNGGIPGKYYFDTPLSEIMTLIDQALAAKA